MLLLDNVVCNQSLMMKLDLMDLSRIFRFIRVIIFCS
jgi:hypothetical protein